MGSTRYLTVRQAAERVGVSASLVYQWCADGTLPHYRLGASGRRGKIVIDPAELDRVLSRAADRASETAERTLATVYERVGFLRRSR